MDVKVEDIEASLGSKGILMRISKPQGGAAVGRLWIGKAKLTWAPGKTSKNVKTIKMDDFIEWLNSQP
ncbi:MAG: hypothetical protein M3401_06675 [Actinomycetota bacterium]|nr:hypothetical protein [Actinomycetota bacterium]